MSQTELTQLITAMNAGDRVAANQLFNLVYDELRTMAYARLARERKGHTLQPTALVHEVWMRLVGSASCEWKDRRHFFAAAAEAMRRLLIDSARRRKCSKRGGANAKRVDLSNDLVSSENPVEDQLLDLSEAVAKLEAIDSEKAQVVKLKFLLGMTNAETASVLGLSAATVERHWAYSRAWLHTRMKENREDTST